MVWVFACTSDIHLAVGEGSVETNAGGAGGASSETLCGISCVSDRQRLVAQSASLARAS